MFCPHCSKPNKEGGKFCVHCGKSLSKEKQLSAATSVPASQSVAPQPLDPKRIEKWKKSIKNAGLSASAFGWLQIIVGSALFAWYILDKNFAESGLAGKIDGSGFVLIVFSATVFILLGNRIKTLKDPQTGRYLYMLIGLSIVLGVLALTNGGFTGIIFLLLFIALISGAGDIGKLMKQESFKSELSKPHHKVTTPWWIGMTIVAIIAFFAAALYAPDRSITNTNTNSSVATNTNQESWITFAPEQGGFSALLPSAPESSTNSQKLANSDVTLTTESHSVGNEYFINVFRYVGTADFSNPQSNLKSVLDGTVKGIDGSILQSSSQKIISGNQALEFQIKANTEVIRGVLIARDQTIYEAFYDYIEGQEDMGAYTKFINGFLLK